MNEEAPSQSLSYPQLSAGHVIGPVFMVNIGGFHAFNADNGVPLLVRLSLDTIILGF